MTVSKLSSFAKYAWAVLIYNLLTVVWGAYVRASGSGAGCGAHWPLCNGVVIPRSPNIEMAVEFTHRVMSGLTLVFVAILVIWAWRKFPRGSMIRWGAAASAFFTLTEALVGAGLVLFQLVAQNDSLARAFSMMAHLVNTFLLLASITLTAWWATARPPETFTMHGGIGWLLLIGLLATIAVGASGSIAALGDTLFPSSSLSEALRQDISPATHLLLRLRVFHPFIAVSAALLAGYTANRLRGQYSERRVSLLALLVLGLLGLQLALGLTNVALLAPIWLQLVHLTVSELVWLSLVLLSAVTVGTLDLLPRPRQEDIHERVEQAKRVG